MFQCLLQIHLKMNTTAIDDGDEQLIQLDRLSLLLSKGFLNEAEYNEKRLQIIDVFLTPTKTNPRNDTSVRYEETIKRAEESIILQQKQIELLCAQLSLSPMSPSTPPSKYSSPVVVDTSVQRRLEWSPSSPSSPTLSPIYNTSTGRVSPITSTSQLLRKLPERNKFRVYLQHIRQFEDSTNLAQHYDKSKKLCSGLIQSSSNTVEKLQNLNRKTKQLGFSNEFITFALIQISYMNNRFDKVLRFLDEYIPQLDLAFSKLKIVCHFMRGYCNQKMKKMREAVRDYEQAIQSDDTFYFAYGNLGCLFYSLYNSTKAIQYLSQAIDLVETREDKIAYYVSRSRAYMYRRKYELALSDCEQALGMDRKHETAIKLRNNILEKAPQLRKQSRFKMFDVH
jgi:tetratricopeptide (TPR) repeat protein